ncbi:MAG: cytochrome [Armatimonadetes bacterium]|jgi:hypothetical protein|nr:cytochrome [Armatimonadota bacterium]
MQYQTTHARLAGLLGAAATCFLVPVSARTGNPPVSAPNATGTALTYTRKKTLDPANPFFQSLGANGRSCNSCHVETAGWSITPTEIEARFEATGGLDPLFRPNDGTTSPTADVSSVEARREAYRLLRTRGLIRVGIGVPAGAEFSLEAADDPYNHATAAELSLFRRPLPATNLKFQSTIMWDGRKTTAGQTLLQNLTDQALDATNGHAQAAAAPSADELKQIVDFEAGLFTAQVTDTLAGSLTTQGGKGGPKSLSSQKYYAGINDPFVARPRGFTATPFTLFKGLARSSRKTPPATAEARAAIARGETNFNRRPFFVSGVSGFNDVLGVPRRSATCGSCHSTPNEGSISNNALMDLGLSDADRRTADIPLYTLRNLTTGAEVQTSDPGRALITGKWSDLNRFKVPSMRGLSARAPYFHNGSAATLRDVVDFYNDRFGINYTNQEIQDLVAFLQSL